MIAMIILKWNETMQKKLTWQPYTKKYVHNLNLNVYLIRNLELIPREWEKFSE